MTRAWKATIAAACVMALTTLFVAAAGVHVRAWWYTRFRGGDLTLVSAQRRDRLHLLGVGLAKFFETHGRFPADIDEFKQRDGQAALLLSDDNPPGYSIQGQYVIRFEALGSAGLEVLIDDPGIDWPGYPARLHVTHPQVEFARWVLMNDGSIRNVSDGVPAFTISEWPRRPAQ
jgi:hypothetical protein